MTNPPESAETVHTVEDGFGSMWQCIHGHPKARCGLEVVRPGKVQCGVCADLERRLADALASNQILRQQQIDEHKAALSREGWVSAGEKLPENSDYVFVLAYRKDGRQFVVSTSEFRWIMAQPDNGFTDWQPLPAPPKA